MYVNVMFVLHTSMKSAFSCLSHAFSSFLSSADTTKELFPAMEPNPEVEPIPGMVPAPITVPAPAWNRLQLRLFEFNGDSDSGIINYRNHNSSSCTQSLFVSVRRSFKESLARKRFEKNIHLKQDGSLTERSIVLTKCKYLNRDRLKYFS